MIDRAEIVLDIQVDAPDDRSWVLILLSNVREATFNNAEVLLRHLLLRPC